MKKYAGSVYRFDWWTYLIMQHVSTVIVCARMTDFNLRFSICIQKKVEKRCVFNYISSNNRAVLAIGKLAVDQEISGDWFKSLSRKSDTY